MTTRNLGAYRLTGRRDRGATGIAHVAIDTNLDEQVELIELPGLGSTDSNTWRAFQGVMQRLSSLESEAVAAPIDFSRRSEDGAWYVTGMPIGLSLHDLRERLGRLHWRQACMILHELAKALSYTHSRGVAHGNLHPGALMVDATGAVQVRRFTVLARVHLELPGQAEVGLAGLYDDVSYLSPEALERRAPSLASDVFALGVIAHELLTGEHPFGTMTGVLAYAESGDEPPDPGAGGITMPRMVRELVMDMLRVRVDKRLHDASLIAEKLREQLNDVGVTRIRSSLSVELERQSGLFRSVAGDAVGADPGEVTTGRANVDGRLSQEAELLLAQMMVASSKRKERSPLSQTRWALILIATLLVVGGGLYLQTAQRQARQASQAAMGAPSESPAQGVDRPETRTTLEPRAVEEQALPPDGDAVAVLRFKAQSALERGENDRAERLARTGLDITGDRDASLHWVLAEALERQGRLDAAVTAYLASDASERGQTRGRIAAGFLLGAANRCEDAIVHYGSALKGGADGARIHTLLGSCQLLVGALDDAVNSLKSARKKGGDELDVLMPLASALDLLGRREEARQVYARVLQLHPQHGRAKVAIDRIDLLRSNPRQAEAWLEKRANQPAAADPEALGMEAYAAFTAGQHERAAELYGRLIKLAGDKATPDQLKNLAIALDRADPGPSSVEAIERALEQLGEDAQLSLLLGKRLLAMGNSTGALKHLEMAARSDDLAAQARLSLGLARLSSGDARGAVTEFGSLVAARPDDRRAIQNLAKAQVEAGMNEAALVTLERFERLAPREVQPWLSRAAILQRLERRDEADSLLKRACGLGVEEACR
ncbi:MAG: hypothetical protein CL940_02450 [Deltaproteobacteria bacterium]|nr:hypothetical protein [Deltaproteobacteria bacterium]